MDSYDIREAKRFFVQLTTVLYFLLVAGLILVLMCYLIRLI
jgi:hypothetical protein